MEHFIEGFGSGIAFFVIFFLSAGVWAKRHPDKIAESMMQRGRKVRNRKPE